LKEKLKSDWTHEKATDQTLEAIKSILLASENLNIVLPVPLKNAYNIRDRRKDVRGSRQHYHYHLEMFITLLGKHKYWMNNKFHTARAGDVFIIPEGVEHQQGYPKCSKNFIDIWIIRMDKYRFCAREWNFFRNSARRIKEKTNRYFILEENTVAPLVYALDSFINGEQTQLSLCHLKHSILGILFTLVDMIKENSQANKETMNNSLIISEIQNYIEKNLTADLSLKALAHIAGFDPFYFHKLFKKHTGTSLHSYINHIRLRKACKLLKEGKTATAVADELGFPSLFYFSRFFKRMIGIPPARWQAQEAIKK